MEEQDKGISPLAGKKITVSLKFIGPARSFKGNIIDGPDKECFQGSNCAHNFPIYQRPLHCQGLVKVLIVQVESLRGCSPQSSSSLFKVESFCGLNSRISDEEE